MDIAGDEGTLGTGKAVPREVGADGSLTDKVSRRRRLSTLLRARPSLPGSRDPSSESLPSAENCFS